MKNLLSIHICDTSKLPYQFVISLILKKCVKDNAFILISQKLPWLKIDFDRIKHESESDGETDANNLDITAQEVLRSKVYT